jgi:hypothetical protein
MALYLWIEQGTPFARRLLIETGLVDVAEKQRPRPFLPNFSFNPFPYLPPELIVSVVSHMPADSIPALHSTNHFFHTHIQIYKRQLIQTRCQEYPVDLLAEYSAIHLADFDSWHQLAKFEKAAETCLTLGSLFGVDGPRFYRAFFRHWESRKSMFFPREQWQEGLLDRLHIYEHCSRSEICDIVHLQMLYRNLLAQLPWSGTLLAGDPSFDRRVHWSFKSDFYRNLVHQIIACGPEFILNILSSDDVLGRCVELLRTDDTRFSCFDDVMAKLLTRLDGGSQAATVWQEEESYFDICASTNWFCETDVHLVPLGNRL